MLLWIAGYFFMGIVTTAVILAYDNEERIQAKDLGIYIAAFFFWPIAGSITIAIIIGETMRKNNGLPNPFYRKKENENN